MKSISILAAFLLIMPHPWCFAQVSLYKTFESNGQPPYAIAISADNKSVYVAAPEEIQTYNRNDSTGNLTYISTITKMPGNTDLVYGAYSIEIDSATNYVYVATWFTLGVFKRDAVTGELSPIQSVKIDGTPSSNITTNNMALSHDSRFLYLTIRQTVFIYQINPETGELSQTDKITDLNHDSNIGFDVSCEISQDDKFLYFTGGHGVSVYERNLSTGSLTFKQILLGNNFENQGLTYALESEISKNNKFIYTVTLSMGSGAINVLQRNTVTGLVTLIQTYGFDYFISGLRDPRSLTLSPNNRMLCINSGNSMALFGTNPETGLIRFIKTFYSTGNFNNSMGGRKYFDHKNRFLYTCPAFTDTIYSYKIDPILEKEQTFCFGDTLTLSTSSEFETYNWSDRSKNPILKVTKEGTYKLEVTDVFHTKITDSVSVKWPQVNLGNDTTLYKDQSLVLTPGTNYKNYNWNNIYADGFYVFLRNDSRYKNDTIVSVSITVEDFNGCKMSDTIHIQMLSVKSSTKLIESQNFNIYPNPTRDYVYFEGIENEIVRIRIYTIDGSLVLQQLQLKNHKIDISSLPKGVYLLGIELSDGVIQKRIVKI